MKLSCSLASTWVSRDLPLLIKPGFRSTCSRARSLFATLSRKKESSKHPRRSLKCSNLHITHTQGTDNIWSFFRAKGFGPQQADNISPGTRGFRLEQFTEPGRTEYAQQLDFNLCKVHPRVQRAGSLSFHILSS